MTSGTGASGLIHPTAVVDPGARLAEDVEVGAYAVIGAGVEIGDKVRIGAMSLVTHSLPEAGEYTSGTPIQPAREWRRNAARFKQLDALARKMRGTSDD